MIKGVNKQVVEISETGNDYFERAIFFVRPEYSGMGEGKLREKAMLMAQKTGAPPVRGEKSVKKRLRDALKLTAAAVCGAAAAGVVAAIVG